MVERGSLGYRRSGEAEEGGERSRSRPGATLSGPCIAFGVLACFVLALTSCTEYANIGTPGAPPPEVAAQMVLRDPRLQPTFDEMAGLEKALENFFEKSSWSARYAQYEIDEEDEAVITDLQRLLPHAHARILALLADPALNANGRFSCSAIAVAGSIGDVERNMSQIMDLPNDTWDWVVNPEILEDMRRLHRETQAFRADLASSLPPEGTPAAPAK